jgi:hypothetical protein
VLGPEVLERRARPRRSAWSRGRRRWNGCRDPPFGWDHVLPGRTGRRARGPLLPGEGAAFVTGDCPTRWRCRGHPFTGSDSDSDSDSNSESGVGHRLRTRFGTRSSGFAFRSAAGLGTASAWSLGLRSHARVAPGSAFGPPSGSPSETKLFSGSASGSASGCSRLRVGIHPPPHRPGADPQRLRCCPHVAVAARHLRRDAPLRRLAHGGVAALQLCEEGLSGSHDEELEAGSEVGARSRRRGASPPREARDY